MTIDEYVGDLLASVFPDGTISLVRAIPGAEFPIIIFRQISGTSVDVAQHLGERRIMNYRYQVDLWHTSAATVSAMQDSLTDAINRHTGVATGITIVDSKPDLSFQTYDSDLNAYRTVVDFTITVEYV